MYDSSNFYPNLVKFPEHIAVIPDGGRRWAKKNNCSYKDSYSISMNLITKIIDYIFQRGAKYFSVYFASTFNFKRTHKEIDDFCTIEWEYLCTTFLEYALKNDINIKIIGTDDINMKPFKKTAIDLESKTRSGIKTVYFCFNYNSFDEIEYACKQVRDNNDSFINHLQVPHPIDILIRTGDANVLSGFLLPQIAFARIYFFKKLFNEFTIDDLRDVVNSYLDFELKYGE